MAKNNLKFNTDEAGVFISLTTTPFGDEPHFFEYLLQVFERYKEKINDANLRMGARESDETFEKYFYKPKGYFLWGTFDLALISLVDDFALGSRDFHPHSDVFGKLLEEGKIYKENKSGQVHELNTFDYQTITTAHSYPVTSENKIANRNYIPLVDFWRNNLHDLPSSSTDALNTDFIGICTFKINNGLILGTGTITIDLIKLKLAAALSEKLAENGIFLILDSFSWYELVIIIFSKDVDKIAECLSIREMTIGELIEFGELNVASLNETEFVDLKEAIYEHSLLANIGYPDPGKENIVNSHVFVYTYSNLGFDFDFVSAILSKGDEPLIKPHFFNLKINLIPRYSVKPGHYKKTKELLVSTAKQKNYEAQFKLLFGDGNAFLNIRSEKSNKDHPHSLTFVEYLYYFKDFLPENNEDLRKHIRKVKTLVYFSDIELEGGEFSVEKHVKPYLKNFTFPSPKVREIRDNLYMLRVSKVVLERIVRMFTNYNDAIQDQVMYIYFIDFRPLLDKLILYIGDHIAHSIYTDIDDLQDCLIKIADVFENAYVNRFLHSYKMNDIRDSSLDFNGSIHQIASAMDTIYKCVYGKLNSLPFNANADSFFDDVIKKMKPYTIQYPIVFVSGHPGIKSNDFSVRLNYFHVFEPSIFMAQLVKEISNYMLDVISRTPCDTADGDYFTYQFQAAQYHIKKKFEVTNEAPYLFYLLERNGEMLLYWVADAVTFYFSYFLNRELYRFWFWHIALQTSASFNSDGEFNDRVFIRLLIRYLMIMEYCGYLDTEKTALAPSVKLQNQWNRHFSKVYSLVKQLFSIDEVKQIYNVHVFDILETRLFEMEYAHFSMDGKELPLASMDYCEPKLNSRHQSEVKMPLNWANVRDWSRFGNYLQRRIHEDPQQHIPKIDCRYSTTPEEGFTDQAYSVLSIFYAHLDIVYSLFSQPYDNSVVDRNFDLSLSKFHLHNVPIDDLFEFLPMKFDILGGMVNIGCRERRMLFKNRVGALRSMIDFSLKNKPKFFTSDKSSNKYVKTDEVPATN